MKTKFILSLVAVLFAVAGALATNSVKSKLFVNKVPVTLPGATNCLQTGVCDTDVAGNCMVNTTQQYRLKQISGEDFICTVGATGQWSSN